MTTMKSMMVGGAAVVVLLGLLAGHDRYVAQVAVLQAYQQAEMARRAKAARQAATDQDVRRERDLAAATTDNRPQTSYAGLTNLEAFVTTAAHAAVPPNAQVRVTVDRFSEFDVLIILPEDPGQHSLLVWTQRLLKPTAKYVHSLTWAGPQTLLAVVDRATIEAVGDWQQLSAAGSARLLRTMQTTDQTDTPASTVSAPAPVEDGDAEVSPVARVLTRFSERVEEARVLLTKCGTLPSAHEVRSTDELKRQIKNLQDYAVAGQELERFFTNPGPELGPLLREEDGRLAEATLRHVGRAQPEARRLFTALEAHCTAAERFLSVMAKHWGAWEAVPSTDKIEFTTLEARTDFVREMKAATRSSAELGVAWRAWQRALAK